MVEDKEWLREEWKPINEYEDTYEVSNLGKVRNKKSGRVLKPGINRQGYEIVSLSKNNVKRMKRVSRLVAIHFIPNDNDLPQINHIDEDRRNNIVTNLEWVTPKQNANHGNRNRKISDVNNKPVMGINLETGEKIIFPSTHATVQFGFNFQNVAQVARGERNTHKGFSWEYIDMNLTRELIDLAFAEEVME